ncbi:MAG: hypothetical protein PG981_001542 [Wolbachia endosymbiont of Ctenocephalides orientis wCori]|nr:MAG: hypothetical protein PG981_001542 [Wolbachia endosymbiont of Ctenocephalides orientis wCori]
MSEVSKSAIEALVCSLKKIEESIKELDKILSEQGEKDEDCKLLTTVSGVGIIVAMNLFQNSFREPKIVNSSYQIESQSKTFSPIAIFICNNFKSF